MSWTESTQWIEQLSMIIMIEWELVPSNWFNICGSIVLVRIDPEFVVPSTMCTSRTPSTGLLNTLCLEPWVCVHVEEHLWENNRIYACYFVGHSPSHQSRETLQDYFRCARHISDCCNTFNSLSATFHELQCPRLKNIKSPYLQAFQLYFTEIDPWIIHDHPQQN